MKLDWTPYDVITFEKCEAKRQLQKQKKLGDPCAIQYWTGRLRACQRLHALLGFHRTQNKLRTATLKELVGDTLTKSEIDELCAKVRARGNWWTPEYRRWLDKCARAAVNREPKPCGPPPTEFIEGTPDEIRNGWPKKEQP